MNLGIRPLTAADRNGLCKFLIYSAVHHYQWDPLFYWEEADEYVADLIFHFCSQGQVLVATEGSAIKGVIGFRTRDWDSVHFGYPTASIDYFFVEWSGGARYSAASALMSQFDKWAKKNVIAFASIKAHPLHGVTRALERSGFYYVGTEFTLSKALSDAGLDRPPDSRIRFFRESDTDALLKIAKSAPWVGRFHSDPAIDDKKADQLYVRWLENGIKKDGARVTVLEIDGKPSGFILWSVERLWRENTVVLVGDQELVAVDPPIRGRGYGKILYRGTLAHMQEAGVKLVKTGIAAHNAPALNSQVKLGFSLNYSAAIFHRFHTFQSS